MRDDERGPDPKAGSPDRKTRIDGNRVIHTVAGSIARGDDAERPRGLTAEQWEEQRTGTKIDERQTREAAHEGHRALERIHGDRDEVAETKKGGGPR